VEVAVDVCALPQEPGQCRGLFKRWYFNYQSRQCEEFVYTGCSGNGNNFATRAKCESQCSKYNIVDVPCFKIEKRWPERKWHR
jgi:hypothetical protein